MNAGNMVLFISKYFTKGFLRIHSAIIYLGSEKVTGENNNGWFHYS